jgi:uncharacterized membrane protein YkoI
MSLRYTALFVATMFALPAMAQTTTTTSTGQIAPSTAPKLDVKVNQSLASSARVSADSAYAIARRTGDNGEVSSAQLKSSGGRLIYQVRVLNGANGASTVDVDAMTGEVVNATRHGGLRSTVMHHQETKKVQEAKRDSATKNP